MAINSRDAQTEHAAAPRVLFLNHTASLGGGEIALRHLVAALDRRRYTPVVVLFAEGPLAALLAEAGVETHVLPLSARVARAGKDTLGLASLLRLRDVADTLAHVRRLAQFIRAQRPALVHTNSLKADIVGGLAARWARTPLLWHVRDRITPDYLPRPVVALFRGLCRVLPDHVIANSRATLATVLPPPAAARGGSGVVHDGVPAALIGPEQGGGPGGDAPDAPASPLIGLVGRISPWKGQHVFLRAAALVRRRAPQARFQIIGAALFGEQAYEREVRALAASLGLDDCVEFTGFRADVPDLIARLDVLVHASTTGEPFGQVIIEGMAAGKPVVATDGGGVPEIVVEGETGLLVPMGAVDAMAGAILRLLGDPAGARAMGRRGRERVRACFTVDLTARRVEAVYDQLLRRPAENPSRRRHIP